MLPGRFRSTGRKRSGDKGEYGQKRSADFHAMDEAIASLANDTKLAQARGQTIA
jgi:hypothetical protein